MNGRTITIFALLAALAPGGGAADATPEAGSRGDAERLLADAKQTRRSAHKKTGEEKRRILEQTVAAYRLLVEHHDDQGDLCAEASFRIGEIERSLGDALAARAAFEAVTARSGDAPRFAARATNELGHLARRAGDLEAALAGYRRVAEQFPNEDGEAVKGLTWAGKMLVALDRPDEARKLWLSLPDSHPSEPVAAVRAADLAALSHIDAGNMIEARRVVEETAARFAEGNLAQEWWSPDVEKALQKMKAPGRLTPSGPN